MPTLGFRHIQDLGITVSSSVKQYLLFKSGSSFYITFQIYLEHFFHFCKSKHLTFFFFRIVFHNNNNNSMQLTLACHPSRPHQHATDTNHGSTLSTLLTLVGIAHQFSHSEGTNGSLTVQLTS